MPLLSLGEKKHPQYLKQLSPKGGNKAALITSPTGEKQCGFSTGGKYAAKHISQSDYKGNKCALSGLTLSGL